MDRRNGYFSPRLLRGGCACLALLLALPITSEAGLFGRKRKKPQSAVVAPAQVLGILVEPLPDGVRLQIDCSARVKSGWGRVEGTQDFYVDLEGAQISEALRHVMIESNGGRQIRSENLGPSQVRICLGIREGVEPKVKRSDDGRSVTVQVKSPEAIPATTFAPPLPPVTEQVRQLPRDPEPATVHPTLPTSRFPNAAARVSGIDVENISEGEAFVRVRVEGRLVSFRSFRVKDPARLVLEMTGAEHAAGPPRYLGKGPLSIGSVRSAQFSSEPLVTRVVVQLPREGAPTRVDRLDTTGELRVRIGGATAAAPSLPVARAPRIRGRLHVGIDPGHGGSDPGAINERLRVCEKDITLDISRRLARLLADSGVQVSMTRRDDRKLEQSERIRFVSQGEADVFVSIHCDAIEGRSDWTGITTYHHGGRTSGRQLAAAIQSRLTEATGLPDRGVRSDLTRFARGGFYVLRNARMPAVLIECGYVSHALTARKMSKPEFRQQVAQGIADGLRKYWEEQGTRSASARLPE